MKRLVSILLAVSLLAAVISFAGCGTSTPYEVSGLVLDDEGKGLAEVTITFTGGYSGTATTDSTGYWEAAVKGRTTVTPSKPGYAFDPQSRLVTKAVSNVDFTGSVDLEFYETTSMMPESEKPNIAYVSEDRSTITFATASDYVRSLAPGDVIVGGPSPQAEYGLLQRVLSVSPDGLSVETEDATFADVIKEGVIEGSSTFTLEDLASEAAMQGAKVSSADEGITLTIDKEFETGLKLSGSLTFFKDIGLELFANYSDGLYGLEFLTSVGMEASLAIACEGETVVEKENVIYKFIGKQPIWVYGIPVLPVFKIVAGVTGDIGGPFNAEVSFEREIGAGFQYQKGLPIQPITIINGDGLVTEDPSISASVSAKFYVGAKFELLAWGFVGPWAEMDLYSKAEAEVKIILGEWDPRLKYDFGVGIDFAAGLEVDLFGIPGFTGELGIGPFDLAYLPIFYGVSGIVKEANTGFGVSGVEIQFRDSRDASIEDSSVITNSRGYWSKFLHTPFLQRASERIVTPVKEGMIFEPRETRVSSGDNDVDFDAAYASEWMYSVSGRVTDPFGDEVSGVTISFSGGFGSVTTAIDGTWSKSGLEGSITVTPSRSGWIFSPSSINVSGYSSSVNFVAATLPILNLNSRICAGGANTGAIKQNGEVLLTGYVDGLDTTGWTSIIDFAIDDLHVVGLKNDGTLIGMGDIPTEVLNWSDVVDVELGRFHVLALKSDGTVVAAGSNSYGQLEVSSWSDIIAISAGDNTSVGLKSDGTVVAVGNNEYGQMDVRDWSGIVRVDAGQAHTVGLKYDGTVVAAGRNLYGQLEVSSWSDIIAISVGNEHTLGLKSSGDVIAIGWNWMGETELSEWHDVIEIAAGTYHSVGLKSDGTVLSKGANHYGQLSTETWDLW